MATKDWTVMVYLAGDNNLGEEMVWALKEMRRARKSDKVAVVAQFDPGGRGIPPQRYVITGDDEDGRLASEGELIPGSKSAKKVLDFKNVLHQNPTKNAVNRLFKKNSGERELELDPKSSSTGNPFTLLRFIHWAHTQYEATNYMLILSGHGSGADEDFLLEDDSPRDSLTICELQKALNVAEKILKRKIAILGMDSCLMSTAEMYFEVRREVDFMVAAEGFELNTGWPYEKILNGMVGVVETAKPEVQAREIAKSMVENYIRYYFDYALAGQSVDLAACVMSQSDALKKAVLALTTRLSTKLEDQQFRDAVVLSHWEAQSYKSDQYVDLWDFCDILKGRCPDVLKFCEKVQDAIAGRIEKDGQGTIVKVADAPHVVLRSCYSGPAFQHSYGLSIYFPWAEVSRYYKNLDFGTTTGWLKFLNTYVECTRRPQRITCEFPKGSLKAKLFNPKPETFVMAADADFPDGIRETRPVNRGIVGQAKSMKNPPRKWCPSECIKELQE